MEYLGLDITSFYRTNGFRYKQSGFNILEIKLYDKLLSILVYL